MAKRLFSPHTPGMRRALLIGVLLSGLACSGAHAWGGVPVSGTLRVHVLNPDGVLEIGAPVYIYDEASQPVLGVASGETIDLPEGKYSVVAAFVKKNDTGFSRTISPVAHVRVVRGDQVSVLLPLAPFPMEAYEMGPVALTR